MFVTHIIMLVAYILDKYLVPGNEGLYDINSGESYFGYNISGEHVYAFETFTPRGIG